MAKPVKNASAYLRAEIVYAVTHEGALHLEDIMDRRTRLTYEYKNEARDAIPEIAEIAGKQLGWSKTRLASEVTSYLKIIEANANAALEQSDKAASSARAKAPSVVKVTG
jgi:glycerol-3-phosphate dehydrogenase